MSQGPGWWEASDGKWYPPKESDQPPAPGWWLAADGKWYPPVEASASPAPGWWLAADGRWYPPEDHPDVTPAASAEDPTGGSTPGSTIGQTPDPSTEVSSVREPEGTPSAPVAGSMAPALPEGKPTHAHAPTERAPRTVAQAASDAMPVRRRSVDATDQIRSRNDASRQDAITQAPARFLAASRALQALQAELTSDVATPEPVAPDPTPRQAIDTPATSSDDAPPPPPPAPPAPPTLVGVPPAPEAPPPRFAGPEPLVELRTSPLGADIDHIGDRLLVFEDRVELRDRLDRVRQHLDGDQITDVVIQRKFTGAVLVIESGGGESIMTRGLRPEQAEQAKAIIHKRTRGGRPANPRGTTAPTTDAPPPSTEPVDAGAGPQTPGPGTPTPESAAARMALLNRGRLNEGDLLRKLADLHRAGVLSDIEFEDKVALVGQLVAGESLAIG